MQGRQDDPRDDQWNRHLLDGFVDLLKQRACKQWMFQNDWCELQREHRQIEHDAHGHFEQHGLVLRVDDWVPDMPRQTEVVQQADRNGKVSQQRRQDRRPHEWPVLLQAKNVHSGCQHEAASRQSHTGHHVEGHPQTPGSSVGEVCDRAQALRETNHGDCGQDAHRGPEDGLEHR